MNILDEIKQRFAASLAEITSDAAGALELIRPTQDAKFGDYQANCAMPLAKQLKEPSRDVAAKILEQLDVSELCESAEIAGPGFINLKLRDDWLATHVAKLETDERFGVSEAERLTYVVDYSSPNVAKSMHVGHIRSTVIGDALCRILRFLGHQVIADNHLGDWGTQFGMIIYGYKHFLDEPAYAQEPIVELGRLYRFVRRVMDYHAAVNSVESAEAQLAQAEETAKAAEAAVASAEKKDKKLAKAAKRARAAVGTAQANLDGLHAKIEAVREEPELLQVCEQHATINEAVLLETAKLHEGDDQALTLWNEILPKCREEIQSIYDRLDIQFDVELGESFYHDRLAHVVQSLTERGLAIESQGAMCIFLDDFEAPMIIRKKDGAFLYATTDLATVQYRMETWSPDVILYVVGAPQAEHFDKLFTVCRLWGYDQVDLRHIAFGSVLGSDGKVFRTRSGDTVGLEGLLDDAVQEALAVVSGNDDAKKSGAELSDSQRQHIAEVIGHAAVKYADLSQNRVSDYVYDKQKMVALRGNTATYLQYAYARAINILAKADVDLSAHASEPIGIEHEKERQLALTLLRFPEACAEVTADYKPNVLAAYLFELASQFAEFYTACPVLKAENDAVQRSRLRLCQLVGRGLKLGLSLLGIQVVERM